MYELLRQLPPEAIVLDLGCGTGSFHYETCCCTIVATDVALKERSAHQDNPRVFWLQSDSAAIPLANQSVDAVISHHTMEHFPDYKLALSEIGRVLRPGGWLWIAVPNGSAVDDHLYRFLFSGGGHVNRFSRDGLVGDVERLAGLNLVGECALFSGFVYLKKPSPEELKYFPPKARVLAEIPEGLSTFCGLAINASTRVADRILGTRFSQYGWAFLFSRVPMDAPTLPLYFNVCRKCGSGVEYARVARRTVAGLGLFRCPHCAELNACVAPPTGLL